MPARASLAIILAAMGLAACAEPEPAPMPNPVAYFEIPVTDMDRAEAFYTALFGFDFERERIDGYEMALFPFSGEGAGASGALAKGDVYKPGKTGPIVYFRVDDIDATLARAAKLNAKLLYPKTDNGPNGFVAEVEDSEGNRIALLQRK